MLALTDAAERVACPASPAAIASANANHRSCACGAVYDQAAVWGTTGRLWCSAYCRAEHGEHGATDSGARKENVMVPVITAYVRPDKCPQGHDLEWLLPDLAYCACALGACPFLWSYEPPEKQPRAGAVLRARFGYHLVRLATRMRELVA